MAEPRKQRFRYRNPTSQHVQILKAVRVVSGLHAAAGLISNGFVQEAGVILRTVDDFLGEIAFLDEAHHSTPNEAQRKFVKSFIEEDMKTTEEHLQGKPKAERVTKLTKKVIASQARRLSEYVEPEETRRALEALSYLLDGYVHGGYPHIMEMFTGQLNGPGYFKMRGMVGTPRVHEFGSWLALFVHPALNRVAGLLQDIGASDKAQKLIEVRRNLELSDEYPGTRAKQRSSGQPKEPSEEP